jgi:hypothetical protein
MGVTNERIVERMVQNGWHRRTAERMVEKGRPGSWQEPLADESPASGVFEGADQNRTGDGCVTAERSVRSPGDDTATCTQHGAFYSGFARCPVCVSWDDGDDA